MNIIMKKITLLSLAMFLGVISTYAQTTKEEKSEMDYNKWSIDLGAGAMTATGPYNIADSDNFSDFTFNGGVRYMFNNKFGLMIDGAYGTIQNNDVSPVVFETKHARADLQGVINLGSVLNFGDFSNRFGLLFHAGGGASFISYDEGALVDNETTINFLAGLRPQIRLSDRISFHVDLTVMGNMNQDISMDGFEPSDSFVTGTRDFDGMVTTITGGISIYLGGHDRHADWVNTSDAYNMDERLSRAENKLDEYEDMLADDDRDGVPNYLDKEPNTINGVAVNTKGQAIDTDGNGIPDELDKSLREKYLTISESEKQKAASGFETVKSLANDGLISVYFEFDSTQPEFYSYDAINQIVLYLKEYDNATATLTGYTDEIGNKAYNKQLSEKRAKRVYDILVKAGISEDRLSHSGGGIDPSVNKDSAKARKLVRRVVFELN